MPIRKQYCSLFFKDFCLKYWIYSAFRKLTLKLLCWFRNACVSFNFGGKVLKSNAFCGFKPSQNIFCYLLKNSHFEFFESKKYLVSRISRLCKRGFIFLITHFFPWKPFSSEQIQCDNYFELLSTQFSIYSDWRE